MPPPLGALAQWVYLRELARRNRAFDNGIGVSRLPVPVISIGNLSVGGTGKTPMVERIVRWLVEDDVRPCIAMRGYGGRDGISDEADEYRDRLPGVPVVAQPDRLVGLRALFETAASRPGCVVLDDGFQHRRIARDLDLVLIDASRSPFDDGVLPAGWLREPVGSLSRADGVVLTHAEAADDPAIEQLRARLSESGREPLAVTRHTWNQLRVITPDGREVTDQPGSLAGRSAVAVCAIGNPGPFMAECRRATGGRVLIEMALRDHDPYRGATVDHLLAAARDSRAEVIVTTAKDWSKLRTVARDRWPCPIVVPSLEMCFDSGEEGLRRRVLGCVSTEDPSDGGGSVARAGP